jgi:hypothetical protein
MVRALVLVTLVAVAPLLLVALAGTVPVDPAGGPTLDASSLALGGVHRLVVAPRAARGPRRRALVVPNRWVSVARPPRRLPTPSPAALERAARAAENRRFCPRSRRAPWAWPPPSRRRVAGRPRVEASSPYRRSLVMTEQKPVLGRWILVALVVGTLLWAFMRERTPEKPWGMALGQDLRGGTTLRFHLDIEGARKSKSLGDGESDAAVVDATLRLLEGRINRYGLAEVNLTSLGENRFEISVPAEVDADGIQKVVEALGDLAFRIEVLPSYGEFRSRDGNVRARSRVGRRAGPEKTDGTERETFDDSPDGFVKFKAREVERFKEFREKGEKYAPLDPAITSWRGSAATTRPRERPTTSRSSSSPPTKPSGCPAASGGRASWRSENNDPAVTFDVKLEYQNVFNAWTGANVGLPMAIVLNGQ